MWVEWERFLVLMRHADFHFFKHHTHLTVGSQSLKIELLGEMGKRRYVKREETY